MPIPSWIEHKSASPELISEVIRAMKTHYRGKDKATTKERLMADLFGLHKGDPNYENTERIFRRCVEIANLEYGALIVSDESVGYWWAISLEDGLVSAERRLSRAKTMFDNAKKLVDNLKTTYGGQMGLGL